MSTNFPGALDTSTTIPAESASTPLATNHVTAHQNIQDSIEAIEAKIGVDSSAVTTSHDYKLGEVTGSDKAVGKTATQTLTNKTLGTGTAITLGSDAEGDTYYRNSSGVLTRLARGTDNYILKMNGNVPNWEAEASISNATTTTAGLSEVATSSEVTAGTATGGSGAPLVVTPDALAASTPVFNGSGLTNIPRLISASATNSSAVTNTTTETTVATIAIPANILGTANGVRFKFSIQVQYTASNANDFTGRVKYGGTTVGSFTIDTTGSGISQTVTAIFDGYILGAGSTSSQEGALGVMSSGLTTGTASFAGGTSSIDSTASQNLTLTFQWEFGTTSTTATMQSYIVERVM